MVSFFPLNIAPFPFPSSWLCAVIWNCVPYLKVASILSCQTEVAPYTWAKFCLGLSLNRRTQHQSRWHFPIVLSFGKVTWGMQNEKYTLEHETLTTRIENQEALQGPTEGGAMQGWHAETYWSSAVCLWLGVMVCILTYIWEMLPTDWTAGAWSRNSWKQALVPE